MISVFEGAPAQGEHNAIARLPGSENQWYAHWLGHPGFSQAVDDFLKRETRRA